MNEKSAGVQHQEYIKLSTKVTVALDTTRRFESRVCIRCMYSMIRPESRYETNANRIAAIFREATRQSEDRGRVRWVRECDRNTWHVPRFVSQVVKFQHENYFFRQGDVRQQQNELF